MRKAYWETRYQSYLKVCEKAKVKPLPFDEWKKWHQSQS